MTEIISKNLGKLFSLEDKVILFSGAAGGIGSVLCEGLASVGATVCMCDLQLDGLKKIEEKIKANGGKAESYKIDMLSRESINSVTDEIAKKHGRIDGLVNCAGVNRRLGMIDADEDTFDRIIGVNLKGVFLLSQRVAKYMIENKSGSIVNIGSYNTVMMLGGNGIYGASKSGVAALTRAQSIEWAKYGIRSNILCPGHISTPLTAALWDDPVRSKYMLDRIAMARAGTPEDLLGMTILLLADASAYMSGAMYHVDGGCLAGGQPWDIAPNPDFPKEDN